MLLALVPLALVGAAALLRGEGGGLRRMRQLAAQERFDEVLAQPVPRGGEEQEGQYLHAVAALLCGRFGQALTILEELRAHGELGDRVPWLRAAALLHLGRFEEARRALHGRPASGEARNLLAQAAVETGDHDLAEELLAEPREDALEEAGRLRILGDLRIRRGDLAGGQHLVEQALKGYRRPGHPVDEGYCLVHLAEARLAGGQPEQGARIAALAVERFRQRPHHVVGLAAGEAVLADALARGGQVARAREALDAASAHAAASDSPVLLLRVRAAEAEVLSAEGRRQDAVRLLGEVVADARALGAVDDADRLARRLPDLDLARHLPDLPPEG